MNFKDIIVVDIETPSQSFLLCGRTYNGEIVDFLINHKQNDLYKMIKWMDGIRNLSTVGWNSLSFDNQILEWIWRNYEKWYDLTGMQIAQLIHEKANDNIENGKYSGFSEFREGELSFKCIDLFKIHHGDNKNRMGSMSLKCMEYYLDRNVDVFDWSNSNETFTDEEIKKLVDYCHEDCNTTFDMYLLTIGDTENPIYKDNNQIQIRLDIQEEFGIPCMNYSNSKIGDEIVKKFYCEEKGIQYNQLPKKGLFRKEIKLKYGVPEYIKFQTPQMQSLVKEIRGTILKPDEDYTTKFKFFNETYTLAKGGLHSQSENKQYHSDEEYVLLDADVSGYYVVTTLERGYYPYHLGKEFLVGYRKIYNKRMELKPLSKDNKRIKGVVLGLKEGGVSVYGKSADMESWLYDKQMTSNICISGELSLLMLIEQQELASNKCIMANTDGATFIVKRSEIDKFYEICNSWSKMTSYEFEYTEFKSLWFSNVNNYIGIKSDGEVKKKGDAFLTHREIFKDKSNRVIQLAIEDYFINGKEPEELINNHNNLFDFGARGKVNRDFYLKAMEKSQETNYNKLIRYYVAKSGSKLYKMKRDTCQTNAAKISEIVADAKYQVVFNTIDIDYEFHLQNVDRQWYIDKAKETIYKIEAGRKAKRQKVNKDQISLF